MSTSDAGLPPDAPDLSETQFTLEKLLGQGGFGAAYQVFNRGLRRRCVLKLLTDIKNPNFVARFFREAQVMANLDHPAIPRVHEVNTLRDGRPYFVMELVDGLSLGDHLVEKGGPLSVAEASIGARPLPTASGRASASAARSVVGRHLSRTSTSHPSISGTRPAP